MGFCIQRRRSRRRTSSWYGLISLPEEIQLTHYCCCLLFLLVFYTMIIFPEKKKKKQMNGPKGKLGFLGGKKARARYLFFL